MRRTVIRIGAVASTALVSTALFIAPTAVAALEADFAAQGDASLLVVDALNFEALSPDTPTLANIGVAPTQAQVDNPDGLGGDVLSRGFGQNLDLSLVDTEVPLDLSTAEQTAPPDNTDPAVTTLIPLDAAAPLLTGSVSTSTALARDPAAVSCPTDGREVISRGTSTTSDLGVLQIDDSTSLVGVVGDGEGTVTASSGTFVGSQGEVIAEGSAQGAEINLANELRIEVSNPVLTATASGRPGGASVVYTGEVRVNGEKIAGTQENQISLEALADVLIPLDEMVLNEAFGPLDEQVLPALQDGINQIAPALLGGQELTLPILTNLIDSGAIDLDELLGIQAIALVTAGMLENVEESADGTRAAATVSTVSVDLNLVSSVLGTEVPIFALDFAPLAAEAEAPVGGIPCGDDPFKDVRKDVTAARVRPGTTFDYLVTVPNRANCTVTDVTITDEVTGPDGFTIVATNPEGTVNGGTITWTLDELAPNEVVNFIITVQVPTTAVSGDTFSNDVDVTGTCNGQPVDGEDEIIDIPVVTTDALPGCQVVGNKGATHTEVRPGQAFSYIVRAYNAGDQDCGRTTVTDTLPDNVGFVSCTPDCTQSGTTVTFVLDNLAAGESEILTITVTAPDTAGEKVPNTAVIDPANGSSITVTTPGPDVTDESILAPLDPVDFNAPGQPDALPRTGGGFALLGLGALAVAGRLRRR